MTNKSDMREFLAGVDRFVAEIGLPGPYVSIFHERNPTATKVQTKIQVVFMFKPPIKPAVRSFVAAADVDVDNWKQSVLDDLRTWMIDLRVEVESPKV